MSESSVLLTRNEAIVIIRTQSAYNDGQQSLHNYSNEQLEKLYFHSFDEYVEIIDN